MARQDEMILITLDYLLNCTDEEHKSNATELNDYALDEYGIPVDHRCANKFLARLKEVYDANPERFPFTLKSNDGIRPRYYIEDKGLTKDEVIAIASAIKDTFQIDERTSKELIDKFVTVNTNKYQKQEIIDAVISQPEKGGKIGNYTARLVRLIEQAIREKRRVIYKMRFADDGEQYVNYFYKIVYVGNDPVAIIIQDGRLVAMYVRELKIVGLDEAMWDDPHCKFQIKDEYHGEFSNPDEELKAHIIPANGRDDNPDDRVRRRAADMSSMVYQTGECTFRFHGDSHTLSIVKTSFENFFHEELRYQSEHGICYAEVTTKIEMFLEWATGFEVASRITITGDNNVLAALEYHCKSLIRRNHLNRYNIDWNGRDTGNH